LNHCFAPYSCQVIRATPQGLALKFASLKKPMPSPSTRSQVTIRRSDGRLETGWEVSYPQEPMPSRVVKMVQDYINNHADQGPAVLCFKKETPNSRALYKIYNIRFLKEVQVLAASNPESRKSTSPATEWIS